MQNNKSFYIRLFGLTIFIEIIALGWFFAMPKEWVTPILPYMPMFFLAVTVLIHKGFLGAINMNPRQFVTRFMLITTIKLLSFLALIFVYAVSRPHDAAQFVLSFFVLYLIYSAFEAVAVVNLNKKDN